MTDVSRKRRIWGWMMFDWASQPYATLLTTFIFGPYFAEIVSAELMADGATEDAAKASAQAYWGYGLAASGLFIAILAPILGAVADSRQRRMPWIWLFSVLYIVGSLGLWWSEPGNF
ncbi:MAG: MFS transporter, partial [Pseudomonadota bacterium]